MSTPIELAMWKILSSECSNPQDNEEDNSDKRKFHLAGHCSSYDILAERDGEWDYSLGMQKYKNITIKVSSS